MHGDSTDSTRGENTVTRRVRCCGPGKHPLHATATTSNLCEHTLGGDATWEHRWRPMSTFDQASTSAPALHPTQQPTIHTRRH